MGRGPSHKCKPIGLQPKLHTTMDKKHYTRDRASANTFSDPFFMFNIQVKLLCQQSPTHEPLVMIIHTRKKRDRIMVGVDHKGQTAEANVQFEMLQRQQ